MPAPTPTTATTNGQLPAPLLTSDEVASFTKACQGVSGANANPRAKQVFDSLMKHLHLFAVETGLTLEEWTQACNVLVESGKMSNEKRNEMILISDVLGIESLLDTMAFKKAGGDDVKNATETAILGPFWVDGAPKYEAGGDIVQDHSIKDKDGKLGITTYLWGKVVDTAGKPIVGCTIDIWQAAPNGYYDQQDPQQPVYNDRGQFVTDKEGRFSVRCLVPTPYPIPFDGGAGHILKLLDRSEIRPAHLHAYLRPPPDSGFVPLITQIFDKNCPHLGKDSVFADGKGSLFVEFKEPFSEEGKESGCKTELKYDFVLAKKNDANGTA